MANGTPRIQLCDCDCDADNDAPRTNVINGCTDATAAPRLRNPSSSSLESAPLECNAILPFHSTFPASDFAAPAMAESGTQNQIASTLTSDRSVTARLPTCLASRCARFHDSPLDDLPRARVTIASTGYPALRSDDASADPKFPAPTIATLGLTPMPGSIAEATSGFRLPASAIHASGSRTAKAGSRYIVLMAKSSKKAARSKERILSSRTVYRGPVFTVSTDDVEEPNGVRARRDVIHHSGSVVVLAVDDADADADSTAPPRVLLERQYRHAATDYLWEIPAGRIDPGENPLHAAKRELLEETGFTAARWRRIFKFYASPGFVAETMSVFLATGLRPGQAQPEADEVIHIKMVPLPTAVSMVLRGTIRDAKTISSVLWLDHMTRAATAKKSGARK